MPPTPPRRRPGARPSAAGRSADGGRRPVSGTPRRQGTPPAVLALLIFVPLLAIVALVSWNHFSSSSPKNVVQTVVEDPNKDLDVLGDRFRKLQTEFRSVGQLDRESNSFETKRSSLVMKLDRFIDEMETLVGPLRVDGVLPDDYQGYSEMKAVAGQMRNDMIRMGGF